MRAWVQILPQPPTGDGPLWQIPFGAKDIIETRGLATEYGSPLYAGRVGTRDAAIVADLRQRGGVLLGKTHTAAFAYRTAAPTRNPRFPDHTPGGSSSGSAAAVAAGVVPFALGTQTKGSVLRPASYCGVTGFKPSYGRYPLEGVLPLAKSLDTLGFFTHTPADMLALWMSMGESAGVPSSRRFGIPDPFPAIDPTMTAAVQRAASRLAAAGASIRPVRLGDMLEQLDEASTTVMFYEGARQHEARYREHGDALLDLAGLVRDGLGISVDRYETARRLIVEATTKMRDIYDATPVILLPAATGPAPHGLEWTGDPGMNAPWTAMGGPAISIPMPVANSLPLGLQLAAAHGEDATLIRTAVWVHQVLHVGTSMPFPDRRSNG